MTTTQAHLPDLADGLLQAFSDVRGLTERLAGLLSPEDQTAQSMPDASPTKWHRAHTTWFFEEFLLTPSARYTAYDPTFRYLFNSYYDQVGPRHPRADRGLVTRPGAAEVQQYRAHVDAAMADLVVAGGDRREAELVRLGLHHEQQHQELLVMDAKHLLSQHPFGPALVPPRPEDAGAAEDGSPTDVPLRWRSVDGGLVEVGHDHREHGFAYDNELPRHKVWLEAFQVADRPVTNADWRAFMADGGYERPELWLSDGWATVRREGWRAPGYWRDRDGEWWVFTCSGERPVRRAEPVCHVSFYEADAYARWAGARLPTEAEWEHAAAHLEVAPAGGTPGRTPVGWTALDPLRAHPEVARAGVLGQVWEWTSSAYLPYPGFAPAEGAVGEYNGKFMCDQHVLRGSSCATPAGHQRLTYRNFFPAGARWAFSGLRLARDTG